MTWEVGQVAHVKAIAAAINNAGASVTWHQIISFPQVAEDWGCNRPATMLVKWWMVKMRASMQWKNNLAAELGWEYKPSVGHAVLQRLLIAA